MAHFPITPNLDKLSTEALSFKNYYNHTAATFRGLRGQLTSGYQFRDGLTDAGTGIAQLSNVEINNIYLHRQTSLPDILKEYGYKSYFIASTEKNSPLNTMLKTLNFDKVLGMGDFIGYQRDRMTDKQTFNALQYFYVLKKIKTNAFLLVCTHLVLIMVKIVQMKNILMVAILSTINSITMIFSWGSLLIFSAQFILWQYVVDNYIGSFYISFDRI